MTIVWLIATHVLCGSLGCLIGAMAGANRRAPRTDAMRRWGDDDPLTLEHNYRNNQH